MKNQHRTLRVFLFGDRTFETTHYVEWFNVHPAGTEPLRGVSGSGLKDANGLISRKIMPQ